MIRGLQFRLDNYIIFGGRNKFDPVANKAWIKEYVNKQEKDRPLMNIIVLLDQHQDYSGGETGEAGWNRLFDSGDAITSGAMNAGYNIVVSDKVLPADAYWIYAKGGENDTLPDDVIQLFSTDSLFLSRHRRVFQVALIFRPDGKMFFRNAGVDGTKTFGFGRGSESASMVSLPAEQTEEISYIGLLQGKPAIYRLRRPVGMDLRAGTVIPKEAISGTVYCSPNKTYGKGPYITGQNGKYLVTAKSLNWEVSYPISDLLSGAGILPSSNVWDLAEKKLQPYLLSRLPSLK